MWCVNKSYKQLCLFVILTGPGWCNGAEPAGAPWFLLCGSAAGAAGDLLDWSAPGSFDPERTEPCGGSRALRAAERRTTGLGGKEWIFSVMDPLSTWLLIWSVSSTWLLHWDVFLLFLHGADNGPVWFIPRVKVCVLLPSFSVLLNKDKVDDH